VDPKGPFGEAGFEVNDMILQMDNVSMMGLDGFVSVMSARDASLSEARNTSTEDLCHA
jgi:hypothetical protein